MTRPFQLFLTALLVLTVASTMAQQLQAQTQHSASPMNGTWQGALTVPGGSLKIVFNFHAGPDGQYIVTLNSPDQEAYGIPTDSVTVSGSRIRIYSKAVAGVFEGSHNPGADSLVGVWKQSGMDFPLVLRRQSNGVQGPKRPQEPRKPFPYRDEEVTIGNPVAGITLAGTLTLPKSGGPFPAVILITGSGPQDRDETVFGHKPFLVLSDYLTRRGIAVLRCDDRGIGKSTGLLSGATSQDFAGDVRSALRYLKSRKEVRADRIGLLGHSEGGIIAPMVAAGSNDVAFIVLMAGTGVPGDEIIVEQSGLIARAMARSESEIGSQADTNKKVFAILRSVKDSVSAVAQLRQLLLGTTASAARKDTQNVNGVINAQIAQVMSPWFRYFVTYDPRPALRKVSCPVLALNGEKDLQVSPKQNLPQIEAALREGGNKNVTIRELPGLNHLFQTASTGAPGEYATIEETIAPGVLTLIGDWILEQCR